MAFGVESRWAGARSRSIWRLSGVLAAIITLLIPPGIHSRNILRKSSRKWRGKGGGRRIVGGGRVRGLVRLVGGYFYETPSESETKEDNTYPSWHKWEPGQLPFMLTGKETVKELAEKGIKAYATQERFRATGDDVGLATQFQGIEEIDWGDNKTGWKTESGGKTYDPVATAEVEKYLEDEADKVRTAYTTLGPVDSGGRQTATIVGGEGTEVITKDALDGRATILGVKQPGTTTAIGTGTSYRTDYGYNADGHQTVLTQHTDVDGAATAVLQEVDEAQPMLGEPNGTYFYDEPFYRRRRRETVRKREVTANHILDRMIYEWIDVEMIDGRLYRALLWKYDNQSNMMLSDATCSQFSRKFGWIETGKSGYVFVNGAGVKTYSFPDPPPYEEVICRAPRQQLDPPTDSYEGGSRTPEFDEDGYQTNVVYQNETHAVRDIAGRFCRGHPRKIMDKGTRLSTRFRLDKYDEPLEMELERKFKRTCRRRETMPGPGGVENLEVFDGSLSDVA